MSGKEGDEKNLVEIEDENMKVLVCQSLTTS